MKKRKRWIQKVVIISILLGFVGLIISHPYIIYIAGEFFGIHCNKIEMHTKNIESVQEIAIEDLEVEESMLLINREYTLEGIRDLAVSYYQDTDIRMNDCAQDAFENLCEAVRLETGEELKISSDYRTLEEQVSLYREDKSTAITPGASEHQAGLALDVYVPYYSGYGFLRSEAGQFINSNCCEYGFIIRYPVHGMFETGIKYEPWHIRYVGQPHASLIYQNHITLEEYIESLERDVWYEAEDYWISRQELSEDNTLEIPTEGEDIVISPDNTGSYMITVKK